MVGAEFTVLIGFHREKLPGRIIYYEEAKQRCGHGGIIPSVEICHEGPIPVVLAFRCIVASRSPTFAFRTYSGYQIPDDDLPIENKRQRNDYAQSKHKGSG